MAKSENPSFVFLSTSLTTRERFTPASVCSTLTRMRARLRFARFSAAVNSPPGGFFFRLPSLSPRWLVSLAAGVLVQRRPWRVGDPLVVGYPLVVRPAGVSLAQVADAPLRRVADDDVLGGVRLLLAGLERIEKASCQLLTTGLLCRGKRI